MFSQQELSKVLFLDIETVGMVKAYEELNEGMRAMWEHKAGFMEGEQTAAEKFYERAGIFAEFGKIVCISFGMLQWKDGIASFKVKSFYGADERNILEEFKDLLENKLSGNKFSGLQLCAHNGKEFDFPYICRRFLIHQIPLPKILRIQGKKPWEVQMLDTLELWKFGDKKSFTKLELLCHLFGIPSPKSDIDGSQVNRVFWQEEGGATRIAHYCEKDVVAIAQLMLKYCIMPLVEEENITHSI